MTFEYASGSDGTEPRSENITFPATSALTDAKSRPVYAKALEEAKRIAESHLDEGARSFQTRIKELIWRDRSTGRFRSKPWAQPTSETKGTPTGLTPEELQDIAREADSRDREGYVSDSEESTEEVDANDPGVPGGRVQQEDMTSSSPGPFSPSPKRHRMGDIDLQAEAMARAFTMYMAKDRVHDCAYKTNGCLYTHRDLDVLKQHIDSCPQKPKEDGKEDILANLAFDKYSKNEIIRKTREVNNETDDNYALLAEPRFWSAPASWTQHQAGAVRSKVGLFMRWNYHFDRIGLTVRNKAVTLEVHDTKRTCLELKMFTKTNLALLHGKAKPIQAAGGDNSSVAWREEYDEISDKAVDTAKLAWRNWVDMNAFIHPGLMDCVAAYRCVTDTPNLTVKVLTDFFNKHLGKHEPEKKGPSVSDPLFQKIGQPARKVGLPACGISTTPRRCSARSSTPRQPPTNTRPPRTSRPRKASNRTANPRTPALGKAQTTGVEEEEEAGPEGARITSRYRKTNTRIWF